METGEASKEPLSPLPFIYARTHDPDQAQYKEWRMPFVVFAGETPKPRGDVEIEQAVMKTREERDWFTSLEWRKKGPPAQQIEFRIGEHPVTLYNWNKERSLTSEQQKKIETALGLLASHFPQVVENLNWILINDKDTPSIFGDPEKYPLNGYAMPTWRALKLLPRGTGLFSHRVAKTSNLEGTTVHEIGHTIQRQFEPEWREKFHWDYCIEHPEEWELKPSPDGTSSKFYNKISGEMAPQAQFPLEPEQIINYYARQNMSEDICDSLVAYLYNPDLLLKISPAKFAIFKKHDADATLPPVSSQEVPVRMPKIKPETVYYYVEEPAAAESPAR